MKNPVKTLIAAISLAGLFSASALATTQTINDNGTMIPAYNNAWIDHVWVTTTASTSCSSSGSLTTGYSAGGGMTLENSSGHILIQYSLASSGPGPNTGSGSISSQPAGDYRVTHGVNGVNGVSWSFSTTLSW